MNIEELIQKAEAGEDVTGQLREKSISVPSWKKLKEEFDPMLHPVMNKEEYPDITIYEERPSENGEVDDFGNPKMVKVASGIEKVSRTPYALQALAVKRTTELCFGIPPKRIYNAENDRQKDISKYIEAIFTRNHIDTVNIQRGRQLFASCEIFTLWYAVEERNNYYGFDSRLKMRCATYSPMLGDDLYPLFDETGDMIAMSIAYNRRVKDKDISYFDTYTATKHLRWSNENGETTGVSKKLILNEDIQIAKIPGVYMFRPLPVWENTSGLVYEMEWAVSRNGNYLRKNSRPILGVFADAGIDFGKSPLLASRDVEQLPSNAKLQYITWNQAIDNLKYYVNELRQMFFTQLQLPDWSYENMKTSPMSGEARKQLFIDCHLKVKDESGRWLEFFDREVNVIKAFLKLMLPDDWASDIDALQVETVITPYTISDEKDEVNVLVTATGGKPIISQQTAVRKLGMVDNADDELQTLRAEAMADALGSAL